MAPGGVEELEYLCLSKGNFEILLRDLLLVKNFRVEVYTNKVIVAPFLDLIGPFFAILIQNN